MAQTTINYDKLIEIYSSPIKTYHPKSTGRRSTHKLDILHFVRNLCNLSCDEVSDKELIKGIHIGLLLGFITYPTILLLMVALDILIA